MDTLKQYVKMSEMLVEIQKLWKPKVGDCYSGDRDKEGILTSAHLEIVQMIPFGGIERIKNELVWLPRQDQLQEMVNFSSNHVMITEFRYFVLGYLEFESMEQLWLTFVMKEKYSKAWSEQSQQWIEENKDEK